MNGPDMRQPAGQESTEHPSGWYVNLADKDAHWHWYDNDEPMSVCGTKAFRGLLATPKQLMEADLPPRLMCRLCGRMLDRPRP